VWEKSRPEEPNLWDTLKTRVYARRQTNLEELERFAEEERAATPQD